MARLKFGLRLELDRSDWVSFWNQIYAFEKMNDPGQQAARPVGDAVRQGIAQRFYSQASATGPWPALHRRTRAERRRLGFPPARPILRRTGSYFRSFTSRTDSAHSEEYKPRATGWRLNIGSDDRRVPILEGGLEKAPARPATLLSPLDEVRIGQALDRLYHRLFRESESG